MRLRRRTLGAFLLAALVTITTRVAMAAPISGTLELIGSGAVSAIAIDWSPTGTGFGSITVGTATGYFTGLPGFTAIQRDFTGDPGSAGAAPAPAFAPAGVPIFLASSLKDFTAPGYAGLFFDLTFIPISSAAVCTGAEVVGDFCRPDPVSPFTFEVLENQTVVSFATQGFFQDSGDVTTRSSATGLYTATLDVPIENFLSVIVSGGSIVFNYEATYATANAVPEPPTMIMMLLGGLLLACSAVRHLRR